MNSNAGFLKQFADSCFENDLTKSQLKKMTFEDWLTVLREKAHQLEIVLSNFDDDYRHFYDNYYTPYEVVTRLFSSERIKNLY